MYLSRCSEVLTVLQSWPKYFFPKVWSPKYFFKSRLMVDPLCPLLKFYKLCIGVIIASVLIITLQTSFYVIAYIVIIKCFKLCIGVKITYIFVIKCYPCYHFLYYYYYYYRFGLLLPFMLNKNTTPQFISNVLLI